MRLKPFKTYDQQVERLKNVHKLNIKERDKGNAVFILQNINYYSLRGYGLCFETENKNKEQHKYRKGTTIYDIKYIYNFDSRLKTEIMRVIGLIENNLRTEISYNFVKNHNFDPECYFNKTNFYDGKNAIKLFKRILKQKIKNENGKLLPKDKNDVIIKKHIEKYEGHFPLWVVIQFFTMGDLLKLFGYMHNEDRVEIAAIYKLTKQEFDNQLYALKQVRNICAHFNRLFGKKHPQIAKYNSNTLFYILLVMKEWLRDKNEWEISYKAINKLIYQLKHRFPSMKLSKIFGFPKDWKRQLRNK